MSNIFSENPTWSIGIAIGLFGIIAGHRLLSRRDRISAFNRAATEFIDSFHLELREIYPIPTNWPKDIDGYLRARFARLSGAVGKFKRHLPKRKQRSLAEDWFRFYCCTGREIDKNCQCYHHYMPFSGVSFVDGKEIRKDNTQTHKDTFRHNVDRILKHAQHK